MLPQPPPDAPAPPPSEAALRSRRKFRWVWIVGVISILGLAVAPMFIRRKRTSCGPTEQVHNARQIGLALYEFEVEYGKFPDATTIAAVRSKTGSLMPLGTKSSNDYFRQLMAGGIAMSEAMFYAKGRGTHKPDGLMNGSQALAKGECGFTYLSGLSSKGNPSRPIIVAPMIPGTDRFDPKPFEGKAVLLRLDNSVTSLPIDKNGHVIVGGKNLFDPSNPIWDGKPPVIAWPEL